MKLKHWMESLSRGRKRSKTDSSSNNMSSVNVVSSKEKSRSKKLSVKDLMMPHGQPREQRKHVRDNYPAVAAYLDHRNPLSDISQNLQSFRTAVSRENRPPITTSKQGREHHYVNVNSLQVGGGIYAVPSITPNKTNPSSGDSQCACYRHQKERLCAMDNSENNSSIYTDGTTSGSGTLNPRRTPNINIRTNPWWIRPNQYSIMTDSTCSSSVSLRDEASRPMPPPKPQRKRPPPAQCVPNVKTPILSCSEDDDDTEMIVCSDKSVGTDGDEYLLDDSSSCFCDECCSSSCHSFSSLKRSSAIFCSNETIQPDCDSDGCSTTSTPTILNDFIDADGETSSERDSAVDSPVSLKASCPGFISSSRSPSSSRPHYSPADSHTSWKYFDDDDEVDSGHGQTASSLGSPGSAEDYGHRISHSSSAHSAHSRQPLLHMSRDDTRENFVDIDTNIEIIRSRLQKQVYQLKHEQTALDRQIFRSRNDDYYGQEENDMIDEDFMIQKKAILVETLSLLKQQLDEQNVRLQSSYSALQNLHKHQGQRGSSQNAIYQPPRNRDHRALSALYNESIRETFC